MEKSEKASVEVERLKSICRDIVDLINTSSDLYVEPVNYNKVLERIENLAVSGYAPKP